MDPTKIYKIESYLTITPEELHMEYDFCGVFCFLVWSSPRYNWLFFPFPILRNEVRILLIRPSFVKKFWTLDTPKETGSIGSTQRRVETLWRSIVTCQDMVVREWIFFWDRSIFDLEQLLSERSGLGYSCVLSLERYITIKFSQLLPSK